MHLKMKKLKNNKVTSIEPQVKSKDRFSVFIDGEFAFGISDFDLYNLKIRVGDTIDEYRMKEIENVISVDKCKNYAVNLVSKKMYTKKEITDKMTNKGYSLTAVSEVLDILEEYGYINDEVFAKLYVKEYGRKYGATKIKFSLKLKGIPDEIIEESLADFDNRDQLVDLIRHKSKINLNDYKEYSKIMRSFMSKGFSFDEVKECLDIVKKERDVNEI